MKQNTEPMKNLRFQERAAVKHNRELLYKLSDALSAAQEANEVETWLTEDGVEGISRLMDLLIESMPELLGKNTELPVIEVEDTDIFLLPFALTMLDARLTLLPADGNHLGMLAELEYMMDDILSGNWFDV